MKPMLKAPGGKRLKLKHDNLLSSFACNLNLRRYPTGAGSGAVIQGAQYSEATRMRRAAEVDRYYKTLYADIERESSAGRAVQGSMFWTWHHIDLKAVAVGTHRGIPPPPRFKPSLVGFSDTL